jgi:hypothetical protein
MLHKGLTQKLFYGGFWDKSILQIDVSLYLCHNLWNCKSCTSVHSPLLNVDLAASQRLAWLLRNVGFRSISWMHWNTFRFYSLFWNREDCCACIFALSYKILEPRLKSGRTTYSWKSGGGGESGIEKTKKLLLRQLRNRPGRQQSIPIVPCAWIPILWKLVSILENQRCLKCDLEPNTLRNPHIGIT